MMGKSYVRRGAYANLSQSNLANFAGNVFDRMSNRPEYQSLATEVSQLGELVARYKTALDTATAGGVDRVGAKNALMSAVMTLLDRIGTLLNLEYKGDEMWVINAGMEFNRSSNRVRSRTTPIPPPQDLRARATGIRGQAEITFRMPERGLVINNGVEYSVDNGVTWINGTYSTGGKLLLENLPSRVIILIRVRSLGTFQRKSHWAETQVEVW